MTRPDLSEADIDVFERARDSLRETYGALANRRPMRKADLDIVERDLKAFEAWLAMVPLRRVSDAKGGG